MGIIPALAGNTRCHRADHQTHQDHPRTRGEHEECDSASAYQLGSSPHSRGTPNASSRSGLHAGIIPALAGNTALPGKASRANRDHPRTRGEHSMFQIIELRIRGSSPHSRGTRSITGFSSDDIRIIPALAGNTHPIP